MHPLAVLLTLLCFPLLASAQSTQADLVSRLVDQALFLRDRPASDQLRFGPDGTLSHLETPISFTLSGIAIHSVDLKNDRLILKGRRVGLKFVQDHPEPVLLSLPSRGTTLQDESIRIEIARPPSGDYTPALDRIFARNLADLVPTLPSFWQTFARAHLLPDPAPDPVIATSPPPPSATAVPEPTPTGGPRIAKVDDQLPPNVAIQVGGGITPPRLLHQVAPEYLVQLRIARYSATVLIKFVIDRDGHPTQLSILRPAGLELDERALAAVTHYRFQPAMRNGEPVPVQINIDVNFQIF